jgi:hypothetical protein
MNIHRDVINKKSPCESLKFSIWNEKTIKNDENHNIEKKIKWKFLALGKCMVL